MNHHPSRISIFLNLVLLQHFFIFFNLLEQPALTIVTMIKIFTFPKPLKFIHSASDSSLVYNMNSASNLFVLFKFSSASTIVLPLYLHFYNPYQNFLINNLLLILFFLLILYHFYFYHSCCSISSVYFFTTLFKILIDPYSRQAFSSPNSWMASLQLV